MTCRAASLRRARRSRAGSTPTRRPRTWPRPVGGFRAALGRAGVALARLPAGSAAGRWCSSECLCAVVAARQAGRSISISRRHGSRPRSRRTSAAITQSRSAARSIERDASGRTALRIRDIVVRDAAWRDRRERAQAPKSACRASGLMTGRVRAKRLSLVGAEMQVRIEPDSKVTVFAGTNRQPFVTASVTEPALRAGLAKSRSSAAVRTVADLPAQPRTIPELHRAARLDRQPRRYRSRRPRPQRARSEERQSHRRRPAQRQAMGVRGHQSEPDAPERRRRSADHRLGSRRAAVAVARDGQSRGEGGIRKVEIETERLPAKDLMLALRIGDGQFEPDMPMSARVRASIGADGMPQMVEGRIVARARGTIVDPDDPLSTCRDRPGRIHPGMGCRAARPLSCRSRSSRAAIALRCLAQLDAPRDERHHLGAQDHRRHASCSRHRPTTRTHVVLNRSRLRLRIDPDKQRIDVEQGEVGNMDLGLAISGSLDFSGESRAWRWASPARGCRSLP